MANEPEMQSARNEGVGGGHQYASFGTVFVVIMGLFVRQIKLN